MHTPRTNYSPALIKYLVSQNIFESEPFSLVDVGVSGDIDAYWKAFGSFRAFGFDPLVKEVERLSALHKDDGQSFFSYLVGYKKYDQIFPPDLRNDRTRIPDTQPFGRTSSTRAQALAKVDYVRTYFDQTGAGIYATETIELDDFFLKAHPSNVDFIKIDTDGSDYQVLLGAQALLSERQVLGIAVESQFHGLVHDAANNFSNIDRLLRGLGFSLFDLEVYRYTRAALPKPFVYGIPAQTIDGQVLWGDALYLRDVGQERYESTWSMSFSSGKLLKLAALFELFGLGDCAAELLTNYGDRLAPAVDVERCLNLLTPPLRGRQLSYRQYNQVFESDTKAFFPAS
jgi:FkbM family methyltransferase